MVGAKIASEKSASEAVRSRFAAADAMRALAILLMVQGHVFYEVASPGVKSASWYGWHGYVHGFTAPMFMFVAGLVFGLALLRRFKAHASFSSTFKRRTERFLSLLLLGYAIHIPVWSFEKTRRLWKTHGELILKVDALQLIAVGLLIVLFSTLLLKRKLWLFVAMITTTALFVMAAPFVWRMDLGFLPIGIQMYFKNASSSLFPLFPWAGYLTFGTTVAFLEHRFHHHRAKLALTLVFVGALMWSVGHSLTGVGFNPFGEHNYWKTSPWFFLLRGGVLVMLLGGFALMHSHWKSLRTLLALIGGLGFFALAFLAPQLRDFFHSPLITETALLRISVIGGSVAFLAFLGPVILPLLRTRPFEIASQNSLIVYVVHLNLLYRFGVTDVSTARQFKDALSLSESIFAVIAIFALSLFAAWLFDLYRKGCGTRYPLVRRVVWLAAIALFFMR